MINFIDEKGVKHSAIVECKKTKGVNGEKSLSGTIYTNDEILEGIGRGWRLEFENEKYCLTYVYPIDEGNRIVVEFDAVHEFFFDLNKKVVYSELNGSNTAKAYLDLIFNGSGYSYVTEVNIPAFEKEGFGMRNRLDLFKEFISSTGVEFSVNGKVVRILEKVGSNLSTIVKKGFNLNELRIEKDPGSFITYKKGFGAWIDEDDHSKGRLEVEYLSPLASIYGKLEGDPIVDERYKVASNFETRLKNEVESSYGISVDIDMEDLTKAGYEYEQPHEGDYIMAINKDLGFEQKIRIMSYETSYDTNGNIIDHKVSCGSDNIIRKSIKEDDEFRKEIQVGLEGAISTSNKAWVSANGKNAVFEGPNEPTPTAIGDIWYQIDGEEKIMRIWNGYEWKPVFNPGEIEKKVEQAEQEVQTAIDQSNTAINNANQAIADAGFAKNQSATALTQAGQAAADANTAITDAQSALDAYNNMEIGGANYWAISKNAYNSSFMRYDEITGTFFNVSKSVTFPPFKVMILGIPIGYTYTLSFEVKVSLEEIQFSNDTLYVSSAIPNEKHNKPLLVKDKWVKVYGTFDYAVESNSYLHIYIQGMTAADQLEIRNWQLEKGNVVTDYKIPFEDVQVQITDINGELSRKVSQQTFDTLQGTVNTQSTQINQNKADIQARATKTEVNTLTGTVNSLDSQLKVQAGKISALNSKTDGHTTQIGSLESSFSGLNSTVATVKQDLDGLEIGVRNLYTKTKLKNLAWRNDNTISARWDYKGYVIKVNPGEEYILFRLTTTNSRWGVYWTKEEPANDVVCLAAFRQDNQPANTINKLKVPQGYGWLFIYLSPSDTTGSSIPDIMLSKGNKATDWAPAPEDMATVTQFSSLEQTVNGIQTNVANKAEQSEVTQLAGQWSATVAKVDGHTGQISNLGEQINLRVEKEEVISQINLSTEGILIAANKIMITGETFIDYAVVKEANIADGAIATAKIQDASISNAKIINIDASKVVAQKLSAITADIGDITAGTLSGPNIHMNLNNGEVIFRRGTIESDGFKLDMTPGNQSIYLKSKNANWNVDANTVLDYKGIAFRDPTKALYQTEVGLNAIKYARSDVTGSLAEIAWDQTPTSAYGLITLATRERVGNAVTTFNSVRLYEQGIEMSTNQHINMGALNGDFNMTVSKGASTWTVSQNNFYLRARAFAVTQPGYPNILLELGSDATGQYLKSDAVLNRALSSTHDVGIDQWGVIHRKISARKYKKEIKSENLLNAKNVLRINPSSWIDRQGNNQRHYGFIADEFDELGLIEVVQYGLDGQVEGLSYDRISMYHNVILADHERRFNEIDGELAQIKGTHANDIWQLKAEIQELKNEIQALRQSA